MGRLAHGAPWGPDSLTSVQRDAASDDHSLPQNPSVSESDPPPTERTIPILPCRSIDDLLAFYRALGFAVTYQQERPNTYAVVVRGGSSCSSSC